MRLHRWLPKIRFCSSLDKSCRSCAMPAPRAAASLPLRVHRGLEPWLSRLRPWVSAHLDIFSRRRLANAVNIADLRLCAERRAHRMVFDYIDSGADDEISLRRNKTALDEIELHYHVLAGVRPPLDLSTTLLGQRLSLPFFGAPAAGHRMFHEEGEVATARAAMEHGTMFALSTFATSTFEQVNQVHQGPRAFQVLFYSLTRLHFSHMSESILSISHLEILFFSFFCFSLTRPISPICQSPFFPYLTLKFCFFFFFFFFSHLTHFSHMSESILPISHLKILCFFFFFVFLSLDPFLPYVRVHSSQISPLNFVFSALRAPRPRVCQGAAYARESGGVHDARADGGSHMVRETGEGSEEWVHRATILLAAAGADTQK